MEGASRNSFKSSCALPKEAIDGRSFARHTSFHIVVKVLVRLFSGQNVSQNFYSIGKRRMAQGTIKRLTDKGYGFIELENGKDIFFHLSNLDGVRFEELYEGQAVTFTEGQGRKGPQAENVKPA
jgi:CspA family cold shock protein